MQPTLTDAEAPLANAQAAVDLEDYAQGQLLIERVLDPANMAASAAQRARAQVLAATAAYRVSDHARAARHAIHARTLAEESRQPLLVARATTASALLSSSIGGSDKALTELESVLPTVLASDDADLAFHAYNLLGVAYTTLDDPHTAPLWFERAEAPSRFFLTRRQQCRVQCNIARQYLDIGEAHQAAGRIAEAQHAFERTIALNQAALAQAEGVALLDNRFARRGVRQHLPGRTTRQSSTCCGNARPGFAGVSHALHRYAAVAYAICSSSRLRSFF